MSCFDLIHAPVATAARAAATGLVNTPTRPDPEGSGTVEIATRSRPRLRVVWHITFRFCYYSPFRSFPLSCSPCWDMFLVLFGCKWREQVFHGSSVPLPGVRGTAAVHEIIIYLFLCFSIERLLGRPVLRPRAIINNRFQRNEPM